MSLRALPVAIAAIAFAPYSFAIDAAAPIKTAQPPVLKNVELTPTGGLQLQVVDGLGNPVAQTKVQIASKKGVALVSTDASGRASVDELPGGTCFFRIDKQEFACRVWVHGTAPPRALKSIALVNSGPITVRGNRSYRRGNCPQDYCEPCEKTSRISTEAKYGLTLAAIGGTAAYFALSRDNASE